jgi:hypothetical protein
MKRSQSNGNDNYKRLKNSGSISVAAGGSDFLRSNHNTTSEHKEETTKYKGGMHSKLLFFHNIL